MNSGHRVNTMIMELVIALLFFSLASVTIMGVFSAAGEESRRAKAVSAALYRAEDLAERLYAADDMDDVIAGLPQEDPDGNGAVLTAAVETDENGARTALITVTYRGRTVITLPVTRAPGEEDIA